MSLSVGGGSAAFYTNLPSGYASTALTAAGGSASVSDIVDIRVPLPSGGFTAKAGDSLSVRELFGSPGADLMRVALRGEGGGRLVLRGVDVTDRTDFDPLDFNELQYAAGEEGSAQELVVVARTGTRGAGGLWSGIADSAPVQITAAVTGTRSLSVLAALRTPAEGGADAEFVTLAQDASVYAAYGGRAAPTLSGAGNLSLKAGDTLALHDLFTAGGKAEPALYRVALREDAGTGARLLLDGQDVTHRVDFTPEEFVNLQYMAGGDGSAAEILVVARAATKAADGRWTSIVDSPAVAIAAAVTGVRSANAAPALRTAVDPGDADARFMRVAQEAAIFTGSKSRPAPDIGAAGDMTVKAGDSLSLRDLFPVGKGTEPALYRVALRDDPGAAPGGRLVLDGKDVTDRTDFSPMEFLALQYVAGPEGGAQDIMVVARAGQEDGKGGLTAVADSTPAVIRAAVTGARSLNTAGALRTAVDPAAADADFMRVASEAALHAPLGSQVAPALATTGNFTTAAGDAFALRDLFSSPYSAKVEVSGYRVALRDEDLTSGARLMLDGEDVTRRIDFTPAEFNSLLFVAGTGGSSQELLVVARATDARGMKVDSRAVQVTARSTGERSINALPALRAAPEDSYARIASDAAVHAPLGSQAAPPLRAVGDFTAAAGDLFSMNTLFDTAGGVFDAGMTYRVAMREDVAGTGAGARLLLNGEEVTGRTEFTGAEFSALLFQVGPAGSAQDLLVVARRSDAATRLVIDSPALEITARSTGTRSINALAALRADGTGTGFDRVVRDAAVYRTSSAKALSSTVGPAVPAASAAALAAAVGAYRATGSTASATNTLDLSALFAGAGGASSAQLVGLSELITLLGGGTVGGVRSTGTEMAKLTALSLSARA
ncbi:hypothetical protein [Roseomonas populi]|uniref:Uncharacterized protein n=1 Tax=Roseomonas populi TaxID=3121582 RepID=A0ABT1XAL4_9PROT|nr:hypothetical protein [Roseomonas pecuniae]MCR0984796.1 hypothetical protein [Roseomonas pecuniae]